MFAAAIHYLTLFAFSVHAAMGCCAHHHHHAETDACYAVHAQDACHHENDDSKIQIEAGGHEGCCHHGQIETHGNEGDNEHQDQSPCDGSHDCDEPGCNFIAATPETLDVVSSFTWVVAYIGEQSLLSQSVLVGNNFGVQRRDQCVLPGSSRVHCILMQSWQI